MNALPQAAIAAMLLACAPSAFSQNNKYETALQNREERIEAVLSDYQNFLRETGEERLILASDINRLEVDLVKKRSERDKAQRAADTQKLELERIATRIKDMDTLLQYNSGILSEYLNNFESRIHIAEDQIFRKPLFEIRSRLEESDYNSSERILIYFNALEKGIERQERLIGGHAYVGQAISPSGGVNAGDVLLMGPTAYFHSEDSSQTGVLQFNPGTIEPRIAAYPPELASSISQLFESGVGGLPIDASQGKANLLEEARGSLLEHLQKGGWVGYAILALGGVSLLVALVKAIDLRSTKIDLTVDPEAVAETSIRDGENAALEKLSDTRDPIKAILSTGVEFACANPTLAFEAMETAVTRYRPRLQRFLPLLATTAAVAPLLGLLGTVVGMIKTFTLIEVFGTGDAKSLSSGISEALVTTELGLIVAIPALILHGVFRRIIQSRLAAMEEVAEIFVQRLSKETNLNSYDKRARA